MKYIGLRVGRNKGDIWLLTHDQVYKCINRYKPYYLTQAQIDHDVILGHLRQLNINNGQRLR